MARHDREPSIFFLSRWYRIWPFSQSWAHAYHTWGRLATLPFPHGRQGVTPREEYEKIITIFNPHLLHLGSTYLGESDLSYDFLKKFKHSKWKRIVAYHAETYLTKRMKAFTELPPLVDFVYTISPTHVRALEEMTGCSNIRHLPPGTDPEIFYPVEAEKDIDLLYLGHASAVSRNEVIVKLDALFDNLWVGGNWWPQLKIKHHFRGAYKQEFNEWNCRAKIALCLVPDPHAHLEMYYPYRLVNTMSTKTFALATYTPRLEEIFTRKVHLDWYTTFEELVELIKYWLSHDKEREEVAQRGYEFVLENLTLKQQAGQILKDVGLL